MPGCTRTSSRNAFQSVLGGIAGLYEDALFMSNLFAYLDLPADDPHSNGIARAAEISGSGMMYSTRFAFCGSNPGARSASANSLTR